MEIESSFKDKEEDGDREANGDTHGDDPPPVFTLDPEGPIKERLAYALQTGEHGDVAFLVGANEAEQIVLAHKFLLRTSTPEVAVLVDDLPPGAMVKLDFIDPPLFRRLLKLIYTDEVDRRGISKFLAIASTFGFKRLPSTLLNIVKKEGLLVSNVIFALNIAQFMKDEDFEKECCSFIEKNADGVFGDDSIVDLDSNYVKKLLEGDDLLSNDESALFKGLQKWGRHRCPDEWEELWETLGALRLSIRYTLIPSDILIKDVQGSGVLSPEEFAQVLKTILVPEENPLQLNTQPRKQTEKQGERNECQPKGRKRPPPPAPVIGKLEIRQQKSVSQSHPRRRGSRASTPPPAKLSKIMEESGVRTDCDVQTTNSRTDDGNEIQPDGRPTVLNVLHDNTQSVGEVESPPNQVYPQVLQPHTESTPFPSAFSQQQEQPHPLTYHQQGFQPSLQGLPLHYGMAPFPLGFPHRLPGPMNMPPPSPHNAVPFWHPGHMPPMAMPIRPRPPEPNNSNINVASLNPAPTFVSDDTMLFSHSSLDRDYLINCVRNIKKGAASLRHIRLLNTKIFSSNSIAVNRVFLPSLESFSFVQDENLPQSELHPSKEFMGSFHIPGINISRPLSLKDFLFYEKSESQGWTLSQITGVMNVNIVIQSGGAVHLAVDHAHKKLVISYPDEEETSQILDNVPAADWRSIYISGCKIGHLDKFPAVTLENLTLLNVTFGTGVMKVKDYIKQCIYLRNLSMSKKGSVFNLAWLNCQQSLQKLCISNTLVKAEPIIELFSKLTQLYFNRCVIEHPPSFFAIICKKFPSLESFGFRSEQKNPIPLSFIEELTRMKGLTLIVISKAKQQQQDDAISMQNSEAYIEWFKMYVVNRDLPRVMKFGLILRRNPLTGVWFESFDEFKDLGLLHYEMQVGVNELFSPTVFEKMEDEMESRVKIIRDPSPKKIMEVPPAANTIFTVGKERPNIVEIIPGTNSGVNEESSKGASTSTSTALGEMEVHDAMSTSTIISSNSAERNEEMASENEIIFRGSISTSRAAGVINTNENPPQAGKESSPENNNSSKIFETPVTPPNSDGEASTSDKSTATTHCSSSNPRKLGESSKRIEPKTPKKQGLAIAAQPTPRSEEPSPSSDMTENLANKVQIDTTEKSFKESPGSDITKLKYADCSITWDSFLIEARRIVTSLSYITLTNVWLKTRDCDITQFISLPRIKSFDLLNEEKSSPNYPCKRFLNGMFLRNLLFFWDRSEATSPSLHDIGAEIMIRSGGGVHLKVKEGELILGYPEENDGNEILESLPDDLNKLGLVGCHVRLPDLIPTENLEYLRLYNVSLEDTTFSFFLGKCRKLVHVSLQEKSKSPNISLFHAFKKSKSSLESLALSHFHILDTRIHYLQLPNLASLYLNECHVPPYFFGIVARQIPSLEIFGIKATEVPGITYADLRNLVFMPEMKSISVNQTDPLLQEEERWSWLLDYISQLKREDNNFNFSLLKSGSKWNLVRKGADTHYKMMDVKRLFSKKIFTALENGETSTASLPISPRKKAPVKFIETQLSELYYEDCSLDWSKVVRAASASSETVASITLENVKIFVKNKGTLGNQKVVLKNMKSFTINVDEGMSLVPYPDKSFLGGLSLKKLLFFNTTRRTDIPWTLHNLGVEINVNAGGGCHLRVCRGKLLLSYPETSEGDWILANLPDDLDTLCLAGCGIAEPERVPANNLEAVVFYLVEINQVSVTKLLKGASNLKRISVYEVPSGNKAGSEIHFATSFKHCRNTLESVAITKAFLVGISVRLPVVANGLYPAVTQLYLNQCTWVEGFIQQFPSIFPNLVRFGVKCSSESFALTPTDLRELTGRMDYLQLIAVSGGVESNPTYTFLASDLENSKWLSHILSINNLSETSTEFVLRKNGFVGWVAEEYQESLHYELLGVADLFSPQVLKRIEQGEREVFGGL